MTTPTKRRDASGKFAKKNPDCEVATKGYVKCVARKTLGHTHTQKAEGTCWFMGMLFGWAASAAAAIFYGMPNPLSQHIVSITLFSLLCTIGFVEMMGIYEESTSEADEECPDYLKKYEPPCEPKRGCEERE